MQADRVELASALTTHIAWLDSQGTTELFLDISWWPDFGWLEASGFRLARKGELMRISW